MNDGVATAPAKDITRLRDLGAGRRDAIMLDPRLIIVEPGHNSRDFSLPKNRAHIDELKESIRANGFYPWEPLLVRFDIGTKSAYLVDGETRLRATLELIQEGIEIETVPTMQVSGNNEAERLFISLSANTGKPLELWESGSGYARLVNFGWSHEKIAQKLGTTTRTVADAIALADAPHDVKLMLAAEEITPSLALSAIGKLGSNAVAFLKGKVEAAKASGATKAKRDKAPAHVSLRVLVLELLDSINQSDMENTERETAKVSKTALRKLQRALK